jgi:hypothetical protein
MKTDKVTVLLEPELRRFLENEAERQDRSLAGQIRHYLAKAARAAKGQQARAA